MEKSRSPAITVDAGVAKTARELGRALTDANLLSAPMMNSLHKALGDTAALSLNRLDLTGIRAAASAMEPLHPAYRTKLAEVFELVNTRAVGRETAARLSATLAELNLAVVTPQLREAFETLDLAPRFDARIAKALREALRDVPGMTGARLSPHVVEAARNAVALAESEVVAESVDASIARRARSLSASGRRELQSDLAGIAAGLLVLAAILFECKRFELAAAVVVVAAHVMRARWRLTGKLD